MLLRATVTGIHMRAFGTLLARVLRRNRCQELISFAKFIFDERAKISPTHVEDSLVESSFLSGTVPFESNDIALAVDNRLGLWSANHLCNLEILKGHGSTCFFGQGLGCLVQKILPNTPRLGLGTGCLFTHFSPIFRLFFAYFSSPLCRETCAADSGVF